MGDYRPVLERLIAERRQSPMTDWINGCQLPIPHLTAASLVSSVPKDADPPLTLPLPQSNSPVLVSADNNTSSFPVARSSSRRSIDARYVASQQPVGLVRELSQGWPALAICIHYPRPVELGGRCRPIRHLGFSIAANVGLRDPAIGATVAVLTATARAPIRPCLGHIVGLALRETGLGAERFRDGLDVFAFAPHPESQPLDRVFSPVLPVSAVARGRNYCISLRLRVPDLAGGWNIVPVTLYDLTPALGQGGLRSLQRLTDPVMPAALRVGHIDQDLGALLLDDPEEYRRIAAHQARLTLYHGCKLCRADPGKDEGGFVLG